jgi:alpha-N-arabinofuranosidase
VEPTSIRFDPEFEVGRVDPRLFGGFLEHMGRAVYQGVYDPASVHADKNGYRSDVLSALGRLNMSVMRYPGGNFASGYHWADGIGPPGERPTTRELAWQSIEPNTFGSEEYLRLCKIMNWEPMLTVNLGTGTPEEARDWVEYCNASAGTRYADLRLNNGSPSPHKVKLWCLGNEMDGPWQLGHVPADQYAVRAQQAAKMMKDVDPSIEVVVCGSSGPGMPTYLEWDRQVLEYLGDFADYISLHRYVGNPEDDTLDFLAIPNSIDQQIEQIDTTCKYVQAKKRSSRRTLLCFDEWNVWYKNMQMDGEGRHAPHLIEEVYNLEDALVVAGFLQSFIRHADVLKIANLAQIVNVIAPIQTRGDEMLIQSIFYPFEMVSRRKQGTSLRACIQGPVYTGRTNGEVTFIDSSSILDGSRLHVFVTNRNPKEAAEITVDITHRQIRALESAEILSGPDPKAANSYGNPSLITSRPFDQVEIKEGRASVNLPPLAFAAMTLEIET